MDEYVLTTDQSVQVIFVNPPEESFTAYPIFSVKLANSKAGIQDKQITIRIDGESRMWYQSYSSAGASGIINGKKYLISCSAPQSSSNPVYGSNSGRVWLSELAAI